MKLIFKIAFFLAVTVPLFAQKADFTKQVTALPGMVSINLEQASVADSGKIQFKFSLPQKAIEISCSTSQGTASVNLEIRTLENPNSSGVQLLSQPLDCSTTTNSSTIFTTSSVNQDVPITLIISANNSVDMLRVHFKTKSTN